MHPLTLSTPGSTAIIRRINGRDETRQRLCEMGLVVGNEVTILTNQQGNLLITVKDCRIGINSDLATRVMIDS